MNTGELILIIIVIVAIALMFYKFFHRHSLHLNVEQLRNVIEQIFKEADKSPISQNRLIKGLKQHLRVNEKMALQLIGKARKERLIKVENGNVERIVE